jgi:alpha-beta hydrolase superfamily lysophospholipase
MDSIIFRLTLFLIMITETGCSSLLYAPTRVWHVHPEKLGFNYTDISLDSTDGKDPVRIHGWHFRQKSFPKPLGHVIFFHGNGENRSSHFLSLGWILEKGYDYFIFDYQGYGDSEGTPSPEKTVKDGMSALRWFFHESKQSRYTHTPLMVFAQSLGGPVALRSLAELHESGEIPVQLKAIVLDSTFPTYTSAGASVLSQHWLTYIFQPLSWLVLSDHWTPEPKWKSLPKVKYLVLHGEEDRMIDPKLGQKLFDRLPEPKQWILIPGGKHIQSLFVAGGRFRKNFLDLLNGT